MSVEETVRVSGSARVMAVDQATRVVTLQEMSGRTVTLVAGNEVRRLNEVKPGDNVRVDYTASLLAELRPPTASEAANPIAAVQVVERSPQGSAPGAGSARAVRVVTTVQAVDQPRMLVTLRDATGDMFTVQGRNPNNVAKIKVGDTIVITYAESSVVALEKTAP
jgi:hypothetical protein